MSAKEQKTQFTLSGKDFTAQADGYRFAFSGEEILGRMFDKSGNEVFSISFVPVVDGQAMAGSARVWSCNIEDTMHAGWSVGEQEILLTLRFEPKGLTYYYRVSKKDVSTFTPGAIRGNFDIAHNFGPDLERFDIARRVATQVQISSRQAKYQKFFELDQGNYMIPPYLLGLGRHNQSQLVGVGLLDVPDSTIPFDARLTVNELSLNFDHGAPVTSEKYSSPHVGVFLADGRVDLLATYRKSITAYRQFLMSPYPIEEARPDDWWSDPIYTTWGDQVYKKHLEEGKFTSEAGSAKYLSAEMVDSALTKLQENNLHPKTIVLDEGWSTNLGDWQPADDRFGGSLAQFIRGKRQAGYHVVLYFSPFLISPDSAVAAEHSEFLVRDQEGKPRTVSHGGTNFCLFDWTHEGVRQFIEGKIAHMLSMDVLSADGIKIAGTKYLPEPTDKVNDASYGRGELYLFSVLRDLHGFVKATKPTAPMYLACMNPLFEQVFDVIRLGNTSEVNHDVYVQRSATCSALMPGRVIDTDDWAAFQKVIGATTFLKALCGVPNIFSAFYRGEGRLKVQGAMGGCPVRIEPEQYRVLSAAWKLYEFSREADRSKLRVDFDRMEFSAGKPGDKCFLRTYQGGNILAAYCGRNIYLASLLDARAIIDLPGGFAIDRIERIDRDGATSEVEWKKCLGDKAIFTVQSSRDQTYYYHIKGVQ